MTTTPRIPRIAASLGVITIASLALSGCVLRPIGPTVSEDHSVSDGVHALRLETGADIDVKLGDEPGLVLRGARGVLDRLTVEEEDGVLVIGDEPGPGFLIDEVRGTLTVTAFDSIEIEGAGDVDAELSAASRVLISIEGSGDIEASGIDADDVEVRIEGSGDIELHGRAETANYDISGTGNIDAADLEVADAEAVIRGAGDITLYATDTADARIEGMGDITIRGGASVTRRVDGMGDINEQ